MSSAGDDGQRLVDGLDAGRPGVLRAFWNVHRLAVQQDLPASGHERPGQALDQRRLAGAVVADDREHLAGEQVEVDAVEADDAAEGLTSCALTAPGSRVSCGGRVERSSRVMP